MPSTVSFIAIICAINALIITFIFRAFKRRNLANIFELVAIFCLVVYSAKYAYLFGNLFHLGLDQWGSLLFFGFTIAFAIYKVIHFVKIR